MTDLEKQITQLWEAGDDSREVMPRPRRTTRVRAAIDLLDRGEVRVAEIVDDEVVVHEWVKHAILLWFRLHEMETIELGPFEYVDKIPLKQRLRGGGCARRPRGVGPLRRVPRARRDHDAELREHRRVRRRRHDGRHVGDGRVRARRSASACTSRAASAIGGVLEPPQAAPVMIEDDCVHRLALHDRRRRAGRQRAWCSARA